MAYQQDYTDDKDKQDQAAQAADTGAGQDLGPSMASTNTSAGSANSSGQPSAKTGTGYQNLDSYVKANQSQANNMATGITSGITKDLEAANAQKAQFTNDVRGYADKNTVRDTGVINALGSNQSQFAGNKSLTDAYNKQNQGYTGYNDVSQFGNPYQDLSAKYNKIDSTAKGLSSPGGIQGKLQDIYGAQNPNYTQGQQTLDSFLIGGASKDANIGNFLKSYEAQDNLGSFKNTMTGLNQDLGQAKSTSDATKQATQNAYNNALTGYGNTFKQNMQDISDKNKATQTKVEQKQDLLRNLDAVSLYNANLGDTAAAYAKSQGKDLGSLIKSGGPQNLGDIVDQGNVSNYQALLGLTSGQQSQFDFSKSGNKGGFQYDQGVANQLQNLEHAHIKATNPANPLPLVDDRNAAPVTAKEPLTVDGLRGKNGVGWDSLNDEAFNQAMTSKDPKKALNQILGNKKAAVDNYNKTGKYF